MSSYLGLSLGIFLALAPTKFQELQTQVSELSARLWQAEEQVRQMRSRRKEDSKANARVVEIFASHRNAWQAEEKRAEPDRRGPPRNCSPPWKDCGIGENPGRVER
ncbi:uncharacterized protein Pyn_05477 [Prunus yedoensis var. nudiflora]|uniref:Uncharacterized protein n=1 Tax=Prunus yedoensis var. nudiflora TaxID=2094558 RepID=A0A314Z423_PRUYE|nr:uncharacterized protein Pyn_05477 [Prunus yedoensis var. nudiflora]